MDELELIIHFQLLLILHTQTIQARERQVLFRFIGSKKHELSAVGINLHLPGKGNNVLKYSRVMAQVDKLNAEKKTIFNQMKEEFEEKMKKQAELDAERAKIEEAKELERQNRIANKPKGADIKIDKSKPVEEWPDCLDKYQEILNKKKQDTTYIFTDPQFKPDESSLGGDLHQKC